jgi:hypothetical protein
MDARRAANGDISLPLRFDLSEVGIGGKISLEHDVIMQFRKRGDVEDVDGIYSVQWIAAGDGPYPRFIGVMNVSAGADPRTSSLEIDGTYNPPLGLFGRIFDWILGRRLARHSIERFVEKIAQSISPVSSSMTRQ